MRLSRFIPVVALLGSVYGAEPEATPSTSTAPFPGDETRLTPPNVVKGPVWMGFRVSKPDEATRAHLPELPQGIGFVIQSVEAKGPAETAGLKPLDVVWKFEDQLLVNEGQLAVLMRLKKVGDEVPLAVFRGGKEMEISLKIGAFPLNRPLAMGPNVEATVIPEESGMLTRIINREERTASLEVNDGKATLKRMADGKGYELEIRNVAEEIIFNGNLAANGNADAVPEVWRRRVYALRRGLDSAIDGRFEHVRPPRQRIVPPESVEQPAGR